MISKPLLFLLVIFNLRCTYDEFDAKKAADDYCKCLENEKKSGKDFFDSRFKCDGELLAKNRFYRSWYIDQNYSYRYYLLFFSQSYLDSVSTFREVFRKSIEKNCCKIAIMGCDKNDSFQIKMKIMENTPADSIR